MTGRIRRSDRLFFIEQRQQASTPFSHVTAKPARATHESTEAKLVMPYPVLFAFNRSKEYLCHTLFGMKCGRRLSRHKMYSYTQQLAHTGIPYRRSGSLTGSSSVAGISRVCGGKGFTCVSADAWRDWLKPRRTTFCRNFCRGKSFATFLLFVPIMSKFATKVCKP